MNIAISIDSAALQASIAAITSGLADSDGMHGAIATAAGKTVKDHLTANYLPRDGPRGDFWADVIRSTESTSDASAATVTLTELGIGLRYHGGEVAPGKSISSYTGELTRALAIPSAKVPVAGGRQIRPGRAGLLAFIEAKNPGDTVGYLVEGLAIPRKRNTKRGKKGEPYTIPRPGGALLYTLRSITRHNADPNILPSEDDLIKSATSAILAHVKSKED